MAEQLPVWNNPGIEPSTDLKVNGWQPGQKPSAQHFNWLFNRAYKCLEDLQNNKANSTDLMQLQQEFMSHSAEFETLLSNLKELEDNKIESVNGKTGKNVQITSEDITVLNITVTEETLPSEYPLGVSVKYNYMPGNPFNGINVGYGIIETLRPATNNRAIQFLHCFRANGQYIDTYKRTSNDNAWHSWRKEVASTDITDSTTTDDSTKVASAKAVKTVNDNLTQLQQTVTSHLAEMATDAVRPHGMGRIASQDYEVGTWTPTLRGYETDEDGSSYTRQEGSYVRLGRIVFIRFRVTLNSKNPNMRQFAEIRGLPFPPVANGMSILLLYNNLNIAQGDNVFGSLATNNPVIVLKLQSGGNYSNLPVSAITDNTHFEGSFVMMI